MKARKARLAVLERLRKARAKHNGSKEAYRGLHCSNSNAAVVFFFVCSCNSRLKARPLTTLPCFLLSITQDLCTAYLHSSHPLVVVIQIYLYHYHLPTLSNKTL